jgi:hypothetical protein
VGHPVRRRAKVRAKGRNRGIRSEAEVLEQVEADFDGDAAGDWLAVVEAGGELPLAQDGEGFFVEAVSETAEDQRADYFAFGGDGDLELDGALDFGGASFFGVLRLRAADAVRR